MTKEQTAAKHFACTRNEQHLSFCHTTHLDETPRLRQLWHAPTFQLDVKFRGSAGNMWSSTAGTCCTSACIRASYCFLKNCSSILAAECSACFSCLTLNLCSSMASLPSSEWRTGWSLTPVRCSVQSSDRAKNISRDWKKLKMGSSKSRDGKSNSSEAVLHVCYI